MRNGAHRICPHAHCFLHQPPAVGITEDALLRKCNYLDFHKVFQFFPEFQHGFHSQQRRVGHINMGTDILDAMSRVHADCPDDPLPYIGFIQLTLPFSPAFNTFKQCPGLVPDRFACSQAGIQMDMGFDERWENQPALQVCHGFALFRQKLSSDFQKQAVFDPDIL